MPRAQEFNIEKLHLLEAEKSKIRKDFERREGQIEVKKKIEFSKQLNASRIKARIDYRHSYVAFIDLLGVIGAADAKSIPDSSHASLPRYWLEALPGESSPSPQASHGGWFPS